MILPTKHMPHDRALLGIGAELLALLAEPKTISRLWDEVKRRHLAKGGTRVSYDWFVLAIDLLWLVDAIELREGRLHKRKRVRR